MAEVRIAGAVLDKERLTLYKEDGTTLIIKQGDDRIKPILDTIMPVIQAGGIATVKMDTENPYADFEKKSGIRFFRVLKKAVEHIFNRPDLPEHLEIGKTDGKPVQKPAAKPVSNTAQRVEQVMEQTKKPEAPKSPARVEALGAGLITPANAIREDSDDLRNDETVVAVTTDGTVIPGVEKLKHQFDHVKRGDNPQGLQRLLERLGKMIHTREHSVEDILRFLERGDLPIADDGTIIAYKILSYAPGNGRAEGIYVDCHTRKVTQRVGSRVVVDESLVDKNRRNECSNGLHIARRGYLGGFGGDLCVITKIAPEDIITVPHGDANKVRVCAYHIIDLIRDEDFRKLKSNRPMTDTTEAQAQVAKALVGDHIGMIEEVRITEQKGGGLQIRPMENGVVVAAAPISTDHRKAEAVMFDDEKKTQAPAVDANATAAAARASAPKPQAPAAKAEPKRSTREIEAQSLYSRMTDTKRSDKERRQTALDLQAFKKKAKVGWGVLGFDSDAVAAEIQEILALTDKKEEPKAAPAAPKADTKQVNPAQVATKVAEKAPKKPVPAPSKAPEPKKPEPVKATPKPAPKPEVKKEEPKGSTRQTEAARLYTNMTDPKRSLPARRSAAQDLKNFKSKTKVSWTALGLKGDVGDQIQKLLDGNGK